MIDLPDNDSEVTQLVKATLSYLSKQLNLKGVDIVADLKINYPASKFTSKKLTELITLKQVRLKKERLEILLNNYNLAWDKEKWGVQNFRKRKNKILLFFIQRREKSKS